MKQNIFILSDKKHIRKQVFDLINHTIDIGGYDYPFNSMSVYNMDDFYNLEYDDVFKIELRTIKARDDSDLKLIIIDSCLFYDKNYFYLMEENDFIIDIYSDSKNIIRPFIRNSELLSLQNNTLLELRSKLEMTLFRITLLELRSKLEMTLFRITKLRTGKFNSEIFNLFSLTPDELWNDNYYHNKDHTRSVLTDYLFINNFQELDYDILLAIIYHDIKYNPKNTPHENIINALKYFDEQIPRFENLFKFDPDKVKKLIMDADKLIYNELLNSDLSHFLRTPEEIIEIERLIMKEYYHVDFYEYKKEHIEILKNIKKLDYSSDFSYGVDIAIRWLESYEPKIAWFCGSFNPFHIGHDDILKKAEKMFDRVVIVQLKNLSKNLFKINLIDPNKFKNQVILSFDSVPELIKFYKKNYTPILIRGYRNHTDVTESVEWINQINEFFPEEKIQLCMIPGEQKYNHISSSFLRQINNIKDYELYNSLVI